MNLKRRLQNPFALIAQGFIAGAIILYATTPADVRQQSISATVQPAQSAETSQA
jgi:hypothetical protein